MALASGRTTQALLHLQHEGNPIMNDAPPASAATPATLAGDTAPPRLPWAWPPVLLVGLLWLFQFISGQIELTMFQKFGSRMVADALIMLAFLLWWLLGSRLRWRERFALLGTFIGVNILAERMAHPSLQGMAWGMFAVPVALTAAALVWVIARRLSPRGRFVALTIAFALPCGVFSLLRMNGISGEQQADLSWRWSQTREQRYLAQLAQTHGARTPATTQSTAPLLGQADDWPGFRGPGRDSVAGGLTIATDWSANPPRLLWRQQLGPGWSSPIVVGQRVFTQEQRGSNEMVVCRDAETGAELWAHGDPVRFEEGLSGAGPRATPTFAGGKLYTLGATGVLNCLDAGSGRVVWSRDIKAGSAVKPPMWGYASSPLATDGLVIVYAGGDKGLLAFRAETGEPAWSLVTGTQTYTSPQLATLGGQRQVLFLSDIGLVGIDSATGRQLWSFAANAPGAPRAIQPHALSDSLVLISSETDLGTAQLEISHHGDAWESHRNWVSRALKPSFDDYVVDGGYAYGFDGAVFCCTELQSGKRRWREGRYDHGQVVLLVDQHLLLVVGEDGQAILLRAAPEGNQELGRFKAVDGKVWAHPAVARGRMYVRSDQEIACFELRK